jgi:ribonuclease HI
MELSAILHALNFIPDKGTSPVRVMSDSQYSVNCLNVWAHEWEKDGWRVTTGVARPPANLDLIRTIVERIRFLRKTRRVGIHWIAGHSNHKYNEIADRLAGETRRAGMLKTGK